MTWLDQLWYQSHPLRFVLYPFSLLFRLTIKIRRRLLKADTLPIPVIVVGNITVGGTGKTPLVIHLCELLKKQGYRPGIISRGYGGTAKGPLTVLPTMDAESVGDEALVISKRTQCPVVIAKARVQAVHTLYKEHNCDIAISDDGLQHYRLARVLEVAVVDGQRRFGNGFCLPAGPLREPLSRLEEVDFIVVNGEASKHEFTMQYQAQEIKSVKSDQVQVLPEPIHAVVGIGNPNKFFDTLKAQDIVYTPHVFPDHYRYHAADFKQRRPVIMTEKDAVKCQHFAEDDFYYLPICAVLPSEFDQQFLEKVSLIANR